MISDRQVTALGAATELALDIDMPGGQLDLRGGSVELLEAEFRFDKEEMRPLLVGSVGQPAGRIDISVPAYSPGVGRTFNEWDLLLGPRIPVDLKLQMRAGRGIVRLGGIPVRSLELNLGGGELLIDLVDLVGAGTVTGTIEVGHGQARVRLPEDRGVRIRATNPVGLVQANGLSVSTEEPDTWVNAAWGSAADNIDLTVRVGWGEVTLELVGFEETPEDDS